MKKFNSLDEIADAFAENVVRCNPEHKQSGGLIATSVIYGANEVWRDLATLTFGQAVQALKAGMVIRRDGWDCLSLVVFKQVPAHITGEIIPKMQSLPDAAKKFVMEHATFVDYTDQCLIYNKDTGEANSWTPTISDVFAEDWVIVTGIE